MSPNSRGYLSDCILGGNVFLPLLLLFHIGGNLVVWSVRVCQFHLERRHEIFQKGT
jgi:hypothetical protein